MQKLDQYDIDRIAESVFNHFSMDESRKVPSEQYAEVCQAIADEFENEVFEARDGDPRI